MVYVSTMGIFLAPDKWKNMGIVGVIVSQFLAIIHAIWFYFRVYKPDQKRLLIESVLED